MTAALAVPVVLGAVAILVRALRLLVDGTDFGRRWGASGDETYGQTHHRGRR